MKLENQKVAPTGAETNPIGSVQIAEIATLATGACAQGEAVESKVALPNHALAELRKACPLPVLLGKLGLGAHAKPSCTSPLRSDCNPSWGIYQHADRWYWKDHGTGDHGDEITLLARLNHLDEKQDFRQLLTLYREEASKSAHPCVITVTEPKVSESRDLPNFSDLRPTTDALLKQLAAARGFNFEALQWATEREVLVFGEFHSLLVYGVTDRSKRALEWRRLDRQMFQRHGTLPERKSHSVRGSSKNWPVGILEANEARMILLCEGGPDFLAAHQVIMRAGKCESVAPVAMLSASVKIGEEALNHFRDKRVRIVPHQDSAGLRAAGNWASQLRAIQVQVDFVDLAEVGIKGSLKDLADYAQAITQGTCEQGGLL